MDSNDNPRLTFKDFLDKATNLITIFGVTNALFVYSTTIENKQAAGFLLPTFLGLSLLIWFEIIYFALFSNNGSKKYEAFIVLAVCIEIGLIWIFISLFKTMLFVLGTYSTFLLLVYGISILLLQISGKLISKFNNAFIKYMPIVYVIISIVLSYYIFKMVGPLIRPLLPELKFN